MLSTCITKLPYCRAGQKPHSLPFPVECCGTCVNSGQSLVRYTWSDRPLPRLSRPHSWSFHCTPVLAPSTPGCHTGTGWEGRWQRHLGTQLQSVGPRFTHLCKSSLIQNILDETVYVIYRGHSMAWVAPPILPAN